MNQLFTTMLSQTLRGCVFAILIAPVSLLANGGGIYLGQVSGVPENDDFDDVTVLLTGASVFETTGLDSDGADVEFHHSRNRRENPDYTD